MRIAVLASHGGSLLQAVVDACRAGTIRAEVALVISNNRDSGALRRAADAGIAALHLSSRTHPDPYALDRAIADALDQAHIDLVVLAGYMKRLGPKTLHCYRNRIVNTHPALLPKYGGLGFYGSRVHAAVLAAGDETSGATIHYVEGDYDSGPVIAQSSVAVLPNDSIESLEARVKAVERALLVATLAALAKGAVGVVSVRTLGLADVDDFRRIRLTALEEEPTAFSASYEIELTQPEKFRERLAPAHDRFVLGAFVGHRLIGIAGFHRETAPKRRHAGSVTGMFVLANERGRGVARRLLTEIIVRARAFEGLEQLELSVTTGNVAARSLYEALGFVCWGTQPNALKVADKTYAEDHMVLTLGSRERKEP